MLDEQDEEATVMNFVNQVFREALRERATDIPPVKSVAESGLPGFEISMWYGVFAPAKTPAAVVNAYNREITQIVNQPEIRNQITSQGFEIMTGPPEQFAEVVKRDAEKFRKVILDFKMQQDL